MGALTEQGKLKKKSLLFDKAPEPNFWP